MPARLNLLIGGALKPDEVLKFYRYAMHADPRNDLTAGLADAVAMERLAVWVDLLEEIPFSEGRWILKEIYTKPQMLKLQPGHVVEAWELLKKERFGLIRRIRRIDRYLSTLGADDPPHVVEEQLAARERYAKKLPEHVLLGAGLANAPIEPPRRSESRAITSRPVSFEGVLKKV